MIELSRNGAFWQIMLNRPEKANSLTSEMLTELCEITQQARGEAKVLVITGVGNVFSAGADLEQVRNGLATSELWERLSGGIASLPCLTIAALNGTIAGGAFGMALACDLRICVPAARFFYPVMKLGVLPQPSDPVRMNALIGPARTKMILMAGQKIDANQALAWGMVDQIAESQALNQLAQTLAKDALAASPDHIARIKALVNGGRSLS